MKNKIYTSEEEFLADYDSSIYEKLSLTTDILLFSISDGEKENYRRLNKKKFSVLLVKRDEYPFKDNWCLPGGFVKIDESVEDATTRILKAETNLEKIYTEQLYTFSDVNRDPRMRVISTAYMALVNKDKLNTALSKNAEWFNISYTETKNKIKFKLESSNEQIKFILDKKIVDSTTGRYKYEICENDKLAFDHAIVLMTGIERLRNKVSYTDIVFNMMPEYFTLSELQNVYEILLNKELLKPAFRRIIASKVEKTNKMKTGDGHRPSELYKYKGKI